MKTENKYPKVSDVFEVVKNTAPSSWVVSYEYPDDIGVKHPTLTNDNFILLGDVNGYFAWNDSVGTGDQLENIYEVTEIASTFWEQVSKIYPDLFINLGKKPLDLTTAIIDYETGELDEEGFIELFQHLVDTGLAWKLQGHYGRVAIALIEDGRITKGENS
jgi:hypothetical protein